MNRLAILPIYGTVILFAWLFIELIRGEIKRKAFVLHFCSSAIVGFISILLVTLFLNFLRFITNSGIDFGNWGLFIAFSIGGYSMNLFSFISVNKNWSDFQDD